MITFREWLEYTEAVGGAAIKFARPEIEQLKMALKREAKRYRSGPESAPPEPGDLEVLRKKIIRDILSLHSAPDSGNRYVVFDARNSGYFEMSDKTLGFASNQRLSQYVTGIYRIVNAFDPSDREIPVPQDLIPTILRSRMPSQDQQPTG